MTNSEFSNEFDILYNNIMSNQAPGINEYEKSVFLTKAQDNIVKAYFNPYGNKTQEGFDGSERRQIDFSMLVKVTSINEFTEGGAFDSRSITAEIPSNILMIINESLYVTRSTRNLVLTVIPIGYQEYSRLMSKSFKRPLKSQAWRLIHNDTTNKAELVAGFNDVINSYQIRYVKRPQAIILEDLDGVTLDDNKNMAQNCELDPILHQEILQRAVELAKAAYTGDLTSQIALGQTSQTGIGTVLRSQ